MREIKFRARRLVDNKWVYGNLVYSKDAEKGWEAIIIPQENSNMYCGDNKKSIDPALGFERWYRVGINTVGQYTGLKDKNGKEIYEGDIIRESKKKLFVTEWINVIGCYIFKPIDKNAKSWPGFNIGSTKYLEVIGNIYENPELLKAGE